jgi:NADH:ubiquinone oxidoreductase subunit F (NADH-binding)
VYEFALGTRFARVLEASGPTESLAALLVGGYFGTWLDLATMDHVALGHGVLQRAGATLGCGVVAALPASSCGVVETARVARYLASESAGQCGPCVHGLAAVAGDLERLDDEASLRRRLGLIAGRGACRHPDGAVRFVASGLHVFADELARHLRGRRCSGSGRPVLPTAGVHA